MLVMTFGTFDRFHPGHEYYLTEAKKFWDTLITVVARDSTVMSIKSKKPRDLERERLKNIIDSWLADTVVLWSDTHPYQVLLTYRPDILCFWYDQNSFNNEKLEIFLKENHLNPMIIRLPAFNPEKWKSSLL